MAASTLVTFVQGLGPLAISPIFPELIGTFHTDLNGAIQFTGAVILAQGFSNFMWYVILCLNYVCGVKNMLSDIRLIIIYCRIPLSQTYGRRFVLLTSSLMCLAAYAWRASATSYSSFMAASAVAGIGAGVTEVSNLNPK